MMRIKSKVGLRVLAGGLLWLLALGALTAQTKIGDLYYNLNSIDKTAEVTSKPFSVYFSNIVIPESVTYSSTTYAVTEIGYGAFAYCTGLTSVAIPNSVTSINEGAFYGCTGLTSVMIPNSVTSIGSSAFSGCTGLTAINVDESNTRYRSIDGVLYNKDKTVLCQWPGGKTGVVNIPSSVTTIGNGAFFGCTGLTEVTIPASVDTVGNGAFSGCIYNHRTTKTNQKYPSVNL